MREGIGLLAAVIGLATAVLVLLSALNKTDTVSVPVIREVRVLQPNTTTEPTTTVPTTTDTTEPTTVSVPDVVGLRQPDAEQAITDEGLVLLGVDIRARELCEAEGHEAGTAVGTLPPEGTLLSSGDGVRLTVCGD